MDVIKAVDFVKLGKQVVDVTTGTTGLAGVGTVALKGTKYIKKYVDEKAAEHLANVQKSERCVKITLLDNPGTAPANIAAYRMVSEYCGVSWTHPSFKNAFLYHPDSSFRPILFEVGFVWHEGRVRPLKGLVEKTRFEDCIRTHDCCRVAPTGRT